MSTSAPPRHDRPRDAAGFGGLVPSATVARGGETLVAVLGVEHHADGAVIPLLVLSDAPGLVEWDPAIGLQVRDDRGDRYQAQALTATSGLGQLTTTIWVEPALPPGARRLELVVDGIARVSPPREGGPGVARPISGGPWNLVVELVPERTVAELPDEPAERRASREVGSVPVRAHGAFIGVVPVGQARLGEGSAVCVLALERYWDRSVVTLVALGPPDNDAAAPAIGRARIEAWDDCGNRYRVTPVQGASRGSWSEVAAELVPTIPSEARVLGLRVSDVPRGTEGGARLSIPGPFVFGVRLPA
jgi:hypothetical protein